MRQDGTPRRLPVPAIPEEDWALVEDFVRSAVADADPHVTYSVADLTRGATGLAVWCVKVAALPLERDVVFRREVIAEYAARAYPHMSSKGSIRSVLLRMSEVLLSPHLRVAPLAPMPVPTPLRPYSLQQVIEARSWARGLTTEYQKVQAKLLLSLGFGAGLSGGEILRLTARDIRVDADGVLVEVREIRPRLVPVLSDWEQPLIDYTELGQTNPDAFVFRPKRTALNKNACNDFICSHNGRVEPRRMRATWIVRHLSAGIAPHVLMDAAGVESLEAFTRYMAYMPAVDPTLARAMMRNGSRYPNLGTTP